MLPNSTDKYMDEVLTKKAEKIRNEEDDKILKQYGRHRVYENSYEEVEQRFKAAMEKTGKIRYTLENQDIDRNNIHIIRAKKYVFDAMRLLKESQLLVVFSKIVVPEGEEDFRLLPFQLTK